MIHTTFFPRLTMIHIAVSHDGPCRLTGPNEFWQSEVREMVEEFASQSSFRFLVVQAAVFEVLAEAPFDSPEGGLHQAAAMVAHSAFPAAGTPAADLPQVFVARQASGGAVAVLANTGVLSQRDDGRDPRLRESLVHAPMIVAAIAVKFFHRLLHLIQQGLHLAGISRVAGGQH